MIIEGIQKFTLLDYPGHLAATLFLHGCNLRCPFCHNAGLVVRAPASEVSLGDLGAFLSKRKGILDGICVTGGEPLMTDDSLSLLQYIKSFGYKVKLDTNGFYPQRLREAVSRGLADFVAMDIKSSEEGYPAACGREGIDLSPVCESVSFLLSGNVDFEFRTTAVKGLHSPADFASIGRWIEGAPRYFIQQYIDSGDIITPGFSSPSKEEMASFLASVKPFVPSAELRGV